MLIFFATISPRFLFYMLFFLFFCRAATLYAVIFCCARLRYALLDIIMPHNILPNDFMLRMLCLRRATPHMLRAEVRKISAYAQRA